MFSSASDFSRNISSEMQGLHGKSIRNKESLRASNMVGCFHCASMFPSTAVVAWTEEFNPPGETGICPICGVDALIGDAVVPSISIDLLRQMKKLWF